MESRFLRASESVRKVNGRYCVWQASMCLAVWMPLVYLDVVYRGSIGAVGKLQHCIVYAIAYEQCCARTKR
jgi:hypothetical protein